MSERWDMLVIGAGHNGLTCAAYLARAGFRVLVAEARERIGGAAETAEFAPGFRVSSGAHFLYMPVPELTKELGIEIACARRELATVALADDGEHLIIGDRELEGPAGAQDRERYPRHRRELLRFAALLGKLDAAPPPRPARDGRRWAGLGLDVRLLGRREMRELLRIAGMSLHDLLDERFESPLLKGALALDGVLGSHRGPRAPGTVFAALHRMSGRVGGRRGALALPRGGMGAVTTALAASAERNGAVIRTSTRVERLSVNAGRVDGAELAGGERIAARRVISSLDARTTVLGLLGAARVEADFARRVGAIRSPGAAAKLHLALDALPEIPGLAPAAHGERLVVAPDPDYVELASNPAKYGDYSPQPVLELCIPSVSDPLLAPAGKHVLSAVVQYAPHAVRDGWPARREAFERTVLETLERYLPGLGKLVLASELVTPADLEARYGTTGGHWHHGELGLGTSLFNRPVAGASQYAMPVDGLYLCGAATHPGGGVSGACGRNAARAVIARERPR